MKTRQLESKLRENVLDVIEKALRDEGFDVLHVTPAKGINGYALGIPCVDAEKNERTAVVELRFPRGARDGTPYDVYAEAAAYTEDHPTEATAEAIPENELPTFELPTDKE